jgi:hypothetical protein
VTDGLGRLRFLPWLRPGARGRPTGEGGGPARRASRGRDGDDSGAADAAQQSRGPGQYGTG